MTKKYKVALLLLNDLLTSKKDKINALHREDLGYISLIYGNAGNVEKNFKGGYGIIHIISKRNFEDNKQTGIKIVKKLIDVILAGEISKTIKSKQTVHIQKDGYEAVLSLDWKGNKITWLLTGYKIKKV